MHPDQGCHCLLTESLDTTECMIGAPRHRLIVFVFYDTSTFMGHFVSSPRESEKRDRRASSGDEREGQGREENE